MKNRREHDFDSTRKKKNPPGDHFSRSCNGDGQYNTCTPIQYIGSEIQPVYTRPHTTGHEEGKERAEKGGRGSHVRKKEENCSDSKKRDLGSKRRAQTRRSHNSRETFDEIDEIPKNTKNKRLCEIGRKTCRKTGGHHFSAMASTTALCGRHARKNEGAERETSRMMWGTPTLGSHILLASNSEWMKTERESEKRNAEFCRYKTEKTRSRKATTLEKSMGWM